MLSEAQRSMWRSESWTPSTSGSHLLKQHSTQRTSKLWWRELPQTAMLPETYEEGVLPASWHLRFETPDRFMSSLMSLLCSSITRKAHYVDHDHFCSPLWPETDGRHVATLYKSLAPKSYAKCFHQLGSLCISTIRSHELLHIYCFPELAPRWSFIRPWQPRLAILLASPSQERLSRLCSTCILWVYLTFERFSYI